MPLTTDPTNPDTDGDGLLDGEEIDPAIKWSEKRYYSAEIGEFVVDREYFFTMYSDPNNPDTDGDQIYDMQESRSTSGERYSDPRFVDSDGDGFGDFNDPQPLVENEKENMGWDIWETVDFEDYMARRNITEIVFMGVHRVLRSSSYHTSIIIFVAPESEYYNEDEFNNVVNNWGNVHYATLGAGPASGLFGDPLTAKYNREKDMDLSIKVQMTNLTIAAAINEQIPYLIESHENYIEIKSKPDYILFPNKEDEHNSNSYAAGLLISAGIDDLGGPSYKVPGYIYPVPGNLFGVE